ncbi:MAG: hypothetical protein IJV92_04955, partial [Phascolarctobacterium sp.]|nr:hypothetical protein [Phascolarctobacterium sp.]
GDKLMTRYEMAQIVAKAMAKGADCDKLAAEFADELDTLGVRVAKLEKGADAVKITGNIRYHYKQNDVSGKHENKLRSRLFIKGAINDDWSYTGMIENNQNFDDENASTLADKDENEVKFQRAYLEGKLGGLKVTAGRWSNLVAEGNVWDSRMDAVKVVYGKDIKVTAVAGKANASSPKQDYGEYKSLDVAGKVGIVGLTAGYYDFADPANGNTAGEQDKEVWTVAANMPLAKDLKFGAMYLKGDTDKAGAEDDGYVLTLAYKGAKASVPGSWGLSAKWYDQPVATYADHTMNGDADTMAKLGGFEGYGLFANYALAKNIVAQVEYYDLEAKDAAGTEEETLWTQVVFTF